MTNGSLPPSGQMHTEGQDRRSAYTPEPQAAAATSKCSLRSFCLSHSSIGANDQLTDGGPPPPPELPGSAAGPPFGGVPSSALWNFCHNCQISAPILE